jgi:hypothetical protein
VISPRVRAAAISAAVLSSSGCRDHRGAEGGAGTARPAASAPSPIPVDRALPGELAEGTEKAFGLPLPRRMTVGARFADVVSADGVVPPDQVANYVRQRVIADKVETGPAKTVFSKATVKSQPGLVVAIEVTSRGGTTELTVRNITPPPIKPGVSPDDRWRELGYRPDGTPADPTHLE